METEKKPLLLTSAIPKHKLVKTTRNDKRDQGKIVTETGIESNSPDDKSSVSSESGSSSTQSDSYRRHKKKIAKTKKPHRKGNADHRRNKGGWHSVQNKRIPKLEKYCEDSGQNLEKYLV